MSVENYPSAAPTPQNAPKKSETNWRTILMAALIIALLATWGYILWCQVSQGCL